MQNARWIRLLNIAQLTLIGIVILAPLAWMLLSSFKSSFEVTAYPPTLFFRPTLDNYAHLFGTTPFLSYTRNSLIVAGGSTLLGMLLGMPAAYAVSLTRISWPALLALNYNKDRN